MREIVQSEIQAIAEAKVPGYVEAHEKAKELALSAYHLRLARRS